MLELSNVDSAVELFCDFVFTAVNDFVPMIKLRHKYPPWFTRAVCDLLRDKSVHRAAKKNNPSPENVANHARIRSKFKRQAEHSYR